MKIADAAKWGRPFQMGSITVDLQGLQADPGISWVSHRHTGQHLGCIEKGRNGTFRLSINAGPINVGLQGYRSRLEAAKMVNTLIDHADGDLRK